jgi:hypothetical protein
MMNTLPDSPIPNQKMARGIQATGGMGRIISKSGLASPSAATNHPMRSPRGIPIAKARIYPSRASWRLVHT